jgi:eukaryotic-like serine/threonine-protein kinase
MSIGRYTIGARVAGTGLWALHVARMFGAAGFARTVAVKRLEARFRTHEGAVTALTREAWVGGRVRHLNVVQVLDVVRTKGEPMVVLEYVDGVPLAAVMGKTGRRGPSVAVAVVADMLRGLESVHDARSPSGEPLGIVHRGVSPSTVIVGSDGLARIGHLGDEFEGDVAYLSPEQLRNEHLTRMCDVYAAGVVLWELLTGRRLFASEDPGAMISYGRVPPPSAFTAHVPAALDELVLRALDRDPRNRFRTAREMAVAIEDAHAPALAHEVGAWVEENAHAGLAERRAAVAALERYGRPVQRSMPSLRGPARRVRGEPPIFASSRSAQTS